MDMRILFTGVLALLWGLAIAARAELLIEAPTTTTAPATVASQPAGETTTGAGGAEDAFDDSGDVGPLLMAAVILIVCVAALVIGLVIAGIAAAFLLLLLFLGIFSVSVVVGIAKRSMGAAFRAAAAMSGSVLMAIVSPVLLGVALTVMGWGMPVWTVPAAILGGLLAGGCAGYFVAVLAGRMLLRVAEWFRFWKNPQKPVSRSFPTDGDERCE